jgi:PAS domain S-box-containing protein
MPLNISDQQRSTELEQEPQENSSIDHTSVFRYRDLLESISDIVAVLDKELRYKFVNRAFVEAVNLPKAKILNKTPAEIFPGIEKSAWYKAAKTVLTTGNALSVSSEHVYEVGRRKWYRSKIYPVPTGILSISADVTERILAEEELHRQSNLLRSTLDSLINGVFILDNVKPDPDSRLPLIVDCNTAALRIFGYDRNELIGKPPSFLYASNEAFLEFQRLLFSAVEKGELPFNLPEFQMKRKDGTVFTAERTVDRLVNDKGENTGWVTIIRDITKRKRLENEVKQYTEHLMELVAERTAKLKESEERYRSVIENIPYVVWVQRDKKTVYMSQNVTKILGYEPNEIITDDFRWKIKIHHDDSTKVDTTLNDLFANNTPFDIEYRVQRKDGEWIWLHERAVSNIEREGAHYTYGIFSDITERKKLEEELRSARNELTHVISLNPAVIFIEKPSSDHLDLISTFVGDSVLSLLGFEPENFVGEKGMKFWADHIHPDDLRKYRTEIPSLWKDGQHTFEFRFRHRDGNYRWIREEQRVVRDPKGNVQDVVGYFNDVTERKKLEDELSSAKEQLEYAVFSNPAVIVVSKPLPDLSDFIGMFLSKSVSSVLGWEAEQLIGESGDKFWKSHIPVEDLRKYKSEIPSLWRDGHHTFEYRFLHKDGKYRWIREEEKVIRDAEGNVGDVVGYWIDVTERKRLEDELRSAKKQLEYVVTANPAVIYFAKPLPDLSDYSSTYMSENVSSLLGFESRDFTERTNFSATRIHPDDLIVFKQKLPGLWKNGRQTFEYRFLCKDEKYRWIREEAILVRDAAGEPQDVIGYTIDFSEQKKLEEALRTSEQNLRKANENLELGIVETTEQIESIAKLREKLRQTPDLSTGLEMVLETIIWEFGMEIGAIFTFDREKGLANLQAVKTRSENLSLQQTYPLSTRFIEFEATPAKNIAKLVAEDDNSVLRTKTVYSTAIIIGNDVYGVLTLGSNKTEKLTDTDLIILEFYTELMSQTITERRLTVKPVREREETTAPTSWPAPLKKPELELGSIYLTNNQPFAYEIFTKFVLAGSEGLCITREHPSKMRKRLGLEKTPIVWLTGEAFPNEHTIGSLQDLSITLGDFLQKAEHPIIMLDGFEYLITNHTFESFLKFLQIIRDRVQSHNAILIAPITEKAFEPRALGLIEREATILEPKPQKSS